MIFEEIMPPLVPLIVIPAKAGIYINGSPIRSGMTGEGGVKIRYRSCQCSARSFAAMADGLSVGKVRSLQKSVPGGLFPSDTPGL